MTTDLQGWLQDRFAESSEAHGERLPAAGLRITPPLAEWERSYFLFALQEGLFAASDAQFVVSELLQADSETDGIPTRYRIFSETPPLRLLRENVCQLAAAAWLIYKRGWLPRQVRLQESKAEHRSAGGFDLLVSSAAGDNLIWVETKKSAAELSKFVADLRACARRGRHAQAECGFPQNHPRYEFCLEARPRFLWAVAPDGDFAL
ncbi:MAG: hypothetical protein QOG12_2184, partial [Verrucomicrobiota bacterium]